MAKDAEGGVLARVSSCKNCSKSVTVALSVSTKESNTNVIFTYVPFFPEHYAQPT